jgi:hypothetical protein
MPSRLFAQVKALRSQLNEIGFERTRRALAALALSLFISLYLAVAMNAPNGLGPAFGGLALCYAVAFCAVVAEWFWGRWFATGLGWSGIMLGVVALMQLGWTPIFVIYLGLHALVVLALMGTKMAARYDMQEAWRTRYQMDDLGVARLRKTVTRAAASLPSLIVWALGPREGAGMALAGAVAALALASLGLRGVVKLRSWGILALTGAAVAVPMASAARGGFALSTAPADAALPLLVTALLAAAVLPFARPVVRFLTRRA